MKTHLFLLLSLFVFSCQQKQSVAPDLVSDSPNASRLSIGLHEHCDYIAASSGNWSDTSIWVYKDSTGALVDAHDVPGKTNKVFIPAGISVLLDSLQECLDVNLNTTADVVRLNTGQDTLNVWGKLRIYEGAYPGGTSKVFTSGVIGWITGTICFKGSGDRTIIHDGQYNANNTNSGWTCIFDFSPGKIGYIDDRVRIENVKVVSGLLKWREELRLGTNYPGQGADTTVNGRLFVRSGAGVIAGSLIDKSQFASCDSVVFDSGTSLTLTRNLKIDARTLQLPATINYNGYTLTY